MSDLSMFAGVPRWCIELRGPCMETPQYSPSLAFPMRLVEKATEKANDETQ